MNPIITAILDYWKLGRKTRQVSNGWISGNAVCCEHRGESPDVRGRGGFNVGTDSLVWNCFNCQFSTGYKVGMPLSIKFRKLLEWLGLDESTINQLRIEALRLHSDTNFEIVKPIKSFEKVPLPECKLLSSNESNYPEHVKYLNTRGFESTSYPFCVSDQLFFRSRIILPFSLNDQIIGYTARTITNAKPKYFNQWKIPYVFGIDYQQPEWTWTVLTEGPFDALATDGIAVQTNSVSDEQADLIDSLHKQIIVMPDQDKAGTELVKSALMFGWGVSFPEWPDHIKDPAQAVQEFGKLFVMKTIIDNVQTGATAIKIRNKLKLNQLKRLTSR